MITKISIILERHDIMGKFYPKKIEIDRNGKTKYYPVSEFWVNRMMSIANKMGWQSYQTYGKRFSEMVFVRNTK